MRDPDDSTEDNDDCGGCGKDDCPNCGDKSGDDEPEEGDDD